ncbi:Protein GVQW1 [Plecturocebus cupreus]
MPANFCILVEKGFCHVDQAALELLASGDPPASASQSAGVTGILKASGTKEANSLPTGLTGMGRPHCSGSPTQPMTLLPVQSRPRRGPGMEHVLREMQSELRAQSKMPRSPGWSRLCLNMSLQEQRPRHLVSSRSSGQTCPVRGRALGLPEELEEGWLPKWGLRGLKGTEGEELGTPGQGVQVGADLGKDTVHGALGVDLWGDGPQGLSHQVERVDLAMAGPRGQACLPEPNLTDSSLPIEQVGKLRPGDRGWPEATQPSGAHLAYDATFLIEGDDGFCGLVIGLQPLFDGLLIVVHTPTGLSALQEPLGHGLRACVHIQQQCGLSNLQAGTMSLKGTLRAGRHLSHNLPLTKEQGMKEGYMGFRYVGQTGSELLTSSDPPSLASQSAGISDFQKAFLVFLLTPTPRISLCSELCPALQPPRACPRESVPHPPLKLFSLLHLPRVAVDQEAFGGVNFGHHGIPEHVQHCLLGHSKGGRGHEPLIPTPIPPSSLCSHHSCHLKCPLPYTNVPNKPLPLGSLLSIVETLTGNGEPQKGSEPGVVAVSFACVPWALLLVGHPLRVTVTFSSSPHQGPLTSGTSCPFSMISDSFLPLAEPELTSARRRSPVESFSAGEKRGAGLSHSLDPQPEAPLESQACAGPQAEGQTALVLLSGRQTSQPRVSRAVRECSEPGRSQRREGAPGRQTGRGKGLEAKNSAQPAGWATNPHGTSLWVAGPLGLVTSGSQVVFSAGVTRGAAAHGPVLLCLLRPLLFPSQALGRPIARLPWQCQCGLGNHNIGCHGDGCRGEGLWEEVGWAAPRGPPSHEAGGLQELLERLLLRPPVLGVGEATPLQRLMSGAQEWMTDSWLQATAAGPPGTFQSCPGQGAVPGTGRMALPAAEENRARGQRLPRRLDNAPQGRREAARRREVARNCVCLGRGLAGEALRDTEAWGGGVSGSCSHQHSPLQCQSEAVQALLSTSRAPSPMHGPAPHPLRTWLYCPHLACPRAQPRWDPTLCCHSPQDPHLAPSSEPPSGHLWPLPLHSCPQSSPRPLLTTTATLPSGLDPQPASSPTPGAHPGTQATLFLDPHPWAGSPGLSPQPQTIVQPRQAPKASEASQTLPSLSPQRQAPVARPQAELTGPGELTPAALCNPISCHWQMYPMPGCLSPPCNCVGLISGFLLLWTWHPLGAEAALLKALLPQAGQAATFPAECASVGSGNARNPSQLPTGGGAPWARDSHSEDLRSGRTPPCSAPPGNLSPSVLLAPATFLLQNNLGREEASQRPGGQDGLCDLGQLVSPLWACPAAAEEYWVAAEQCCRKAPSAGPGAPLGHAKGSDLEPQECQSEQRGDYLGGCGGGAATHTHAHTRIHTHARIHKGTGSGAPIPSARGTQPSKTHTDHNHGYTAAQTPESPAPARPHPPPVPLPLPAEAPPPDARGHALTWGGVRVGAGASACPARPRGRRQRRLFIRLSARGMPGAGAPEGREGGKEGGRTDRGPGIGAGPSPSPGAQRDRARHRAPRTVHPQVAVPTHPHYALQLAKSFPFRYPHCAQGTLQGTRLGFPYDITGETEARRGAAVCTESHSALVAERPDQGARGLRHALRGFADHSPQAGPHSLARGPSQDPSGTPPPLLGGTLQAPLGLEPPRTQKTTQ